MNNTKKTKQVPVQGQNDEPLLYQRWQEYRNRRRQKVRHIMSLIRKIILLAVLFTAGIFVAKWLFP